ncbi:MAG: hypothetical protein V1678_04885 [Candidatus Aenigmatarchaeota archaeon]
MKEWLKIAYYCLMQSLVFFLPILSIGLNNFVISLGFESWLSSLIMFLAIIPFSFVLAAILHIEGIKYNTKPFISINLLYWAAVIANNISRTGDFSPLFPSFFAAYMIHYIDNLNRKYP